MSNAEIIVFGHFQWSFALDHVLRPTASSFGSLANAVMELVNNLVVDGH